MQSKNWLIIVNCAVAVGANIMGAMGASQIEGAHPLLAIVVMFAAVIFPVYLASRISWRLGYDTGRSGREENRGSALYRQPSSTQS
jgi:hypothetical protein